MQLSISKIKLFKGCRRAYELRYVEGLRPVQTSEALETGRTYHKMLEALYNGEDLPMEPTKECAMVVAYSKYIYPKFRVKAAEKYLEYDLGNGDTLIGYADGVAEDGSIVEHKTTGQEISEAYEYDLQWDEQVLAYMLMTGARKVYYTVCRKPTIRQKKDESNEEFFQRMVEWYDEYSEKKIRSLVLTRTDEEVEEFRRNLLSISVEMAVAENQRKHKSKAVTNPFYRNQGWCYKWGKRCEYASVCLHYDPNQEYVEFVKGDNKNG